MKKLLLVHIALLAGTLSIAQNLNYEWARPVGGTAKDQGNSVIADKSGNVYTTGYFNGKVDFDPDPTTDFFLTSNGGTDIYISKLDIDGKLVWAVNIGDTSDDAGNSINLDASGNVYVTGYFMSKPDFDPGSGSAVLTSAGGTDIFVCKFDASGNFIWAGQMGGKSEDAGNGIDLDANGNVFTTGYFTGKADFDPHTKDTLIFNSNGGRDIFISRLDNKGNYGWAGQMGGTGEDEGMGIALDSIGYVFTTGYFQGQADFNPHPSNTNNLSTVGDEDVFVSKIDIKGSYIWAMPAGDKAPDRGNAIAVDAMGNSYTTGYFYGGPDFDPGTAKGQVFTLSSNGDFDIFVWKLSASGAFVWAKNMGGTYDDGGFSIALDESKNVFVTGGFSDAADFDPGSGTQTLTSSGGYDAFISKLDVSGNYDWAARIGDSKDDGGLGIHVDKTKSVYTIGGFASTVDFDPRSGTKNLTSAGDQDAFILKLSVCKATTSDFTASTCNTVYSFNGNSYFKTGTYVVTLKNSTGCDSLVTLKLTMNSPTFYNFTAGSCDKYVLNGIIYTKEGTYDQTLVNKAGCDSFIVLELKFLTSARTLKEKECNSYTLNGQTYNKTGKYTQVKTNAKGCDSTITLDLTIVNSSVGTYTTTACDAITINSKVYTTSGTYLQTITNAAGCDSNLTIKLTVNNTSSGTLDINECSSYKFFTQTLTQSGTYKHVVPNKKGCDSTIILNLFINNTANDVTITSCKNYTIGTQTLTKSGTYNVIIPNKKGCDSAVKLNLTIKNVLTTVTGMGGVLTADANNATYQWLDCNKGNAAIAGQTGRSFKPTVTGDYAVAITQETCTDNSVCINVKVGKISNSSTNQLTVFPNPMNGEATVLLSWHLNKGSIKLMNAIGQTLAERSDLTGDKFSIDLSDKAKGIYFVEISGDGNTARVRVIKD